MHHLAMCSTKGNENYEKKGRKIGTTYQVQALDIWVDFSCAYAKKSNMYMGFMLL